MGKDVTISAPPARAVASAPAPVAFPTSTTSQPPDEAPAPPIKLDAGLDEVPSPGTPLALLTVVVALASWYGWRRLRAR